NHVRAKATLAIAARTATANGTTVDRALSGASGTNEWFSTAMLVVHTGAITDGTHAITVEVSDNGTDWAAAPAAHIQGSLPSVGSSNDDALYEVGYIGPSRYLRAVTTVAGATTGGVYGATILLGFPSVLPISRT
ncbi:hypothetical protein ACFC1L_44385, partial [Streptomyces sp. NPDC056210]